MRRAAAFAACLGAATVIATADLAVKQWAAEDLQNAPPRALLPFFNLAYAENPGMAFGLLAGGGDGARIFLAAASVLLTAFFIALLWRAAGRWTAGGGDFAAARNMAAAVSLIIGGAGGNGVERVWRGRVIDYADLHWGGWHWPAFNLADAAITFGTAWLLWLLWRHPRLL